MSGLPASRQLLNITKAALDNCEAECERLRAALKEIAKDGSCTCHTEIAIRALKDKP